MLADIAAEKGNLDFPEFQDILDLGLADIAVKKVFLDLAERKEMSEKAVQADIVAEKGNLDIAVKAGLPDTGVIPVPMGNPVILGKEASPDSAGLAVSPEIAEILDIAEKEALSDLRDCQELADSAARKGIKEIRELTDMMASQELPGIVERKDLAASLDLAAKREALAIRATLAIRGIREHLVDREHLDTADLVCLAILAKKAIKELLDIPVYQALAEYRGHPDTAAFPVSAEVVSQDSQDKAEQD